MVAMLLSIWGRSIILLCSLVAIPTENLAVRESVGTTALNTYLVMSFPRAPPSFSTVILPNQFFVTPSLVRVCTTCALAFSTGSLPCLLDGLL